MTEKLEPITDDAETSEFVRVARAVMGASDPVPAEVTELAKMAFDFQGIPALATLQSEELVGTRSGGAGVLSKVELGDTTLIWCTENDYLSGVVSRPGAIGLDLQTTNDRFPVSVDAEDGMFVVAVPLGAYRFVITEGDDSWATTWAS